MTNNSNNNNNKSTSLRNIEIDLKSLNNEEYSDDEDIIYKDYSNNNNLKNSFERRRLIQINNNNNNNNKNNNFQINNTNKNHKYCDNFNKEVIYNNNNNNENQCIFNYYSPNYSCTPTSKYRSNNFKYLTDFQQYDVLDKPIISVIIPFFNTNSKYLNECLESILILQSFRSIEVLLIDDGTTKEESIKLYKQWLINEPKRFKVYINQFNLGLPHSRNIGIYHSRGDYIFFFDSDDILEPTALEKMVWKLKTSNHIKFTKGFVVGFQAMNYTWSKGFEEKSLFKKENPTTFSIMYKREIFGKKLLNLKIDEYIYNNEDQSFSSQYNNNKNNNNNNNNKELSILYKYNYPELLLEFQLNSTIKDGMEDWDFHLKCAENDYWGETIPEYFDWYRRKELKQSQNDWKNQKESERLNFIKEFKFKYPKIYNDNYFPNPLKENKEFKLIKPNSTINNSLLKLDNKPRLLLILPWLQMGGADKFNLNLCKQLLLNNWDITIATTCQSENQWLSTFQQYCTQDIFLYNDQFLDYSNYPEFVCYLIESRSIDTVLISNSELGYILLPFIRKYCNNDQKLKVIDYNHMEEENWRNGGHSRLSLSLFEYLDQIVVSSNHLKNWFINNQQQKQNEEINKISVIYINVDQNEFKRNITERNIIKNLYDIESNQVVILFAARLTNQKNPLKVIEIIRSLKDSLKNQNNENNIQLPFKVLIVGDGPLRSNVEELINKYGLKDLIILLGDVPPNDMKSIISTSDIVLLPSENEGVSMIFYESMSVGLVPVGSNIGGQSELVSNDCGFLVNRTTDTNDNEEYIKILNDLILNPKKIIKMGNKCKERINSKFQINQMGHSMISTICGTVLNDQTNEIINNNDDQLSTFLVDEFTIQSIERIKNERIFEKSKKDFNKLYSLEQDLKKLKQEMEELLLK